MQWRMNATKVLLLESINSYRQQDEALKLADKVARNVRDDISTDNRQGKCCACGGYGSTPLQLYSLGRSDCSCAGTPDTGEFTRTEKRGGCGIRQGEDKAGIWIKPSPPTTASIIPAKKAASARAT